MLRQIRREIARAERAGIDWRAVLDVWRHRVPLLWHRLPIDERRRFLRHLRPLWDIHRHRMAPEIATQIQPMQASGQLEVRAGTIEAYHALDEGIAVRFRTRGTNVETRVVGDWLVNCAGPALDFRHVREPLIHDLLARGLVRPEPLGLGLETTRDLRLVGRNGRPHGSLFALGPLTRGTFWETSAVPEIREQGAQPGQASGDERYRSRRLSCRIRPGIARGCGRERRRASRPQRRRGVRAASSVAIATCSAWLRISGTETISQSAPRTIGPAPNSRRDGRPSRPIKAP